MPASLEYADQSEAYKNFISSINSEVTKKCYRSSLTYFMRFTKNYQPVMYLNKTRPSPIGRNNTRLYYLLKTR